MSRKSTIIECFIVFVAMFLNLHFVPILDMDSIWNYGFSINILNGMVPYRDFNMIVTPLYSFVCAFFLKFCSSYLFFNIINAGLVSCIYYLAKKLVGRSAIIFIAFLCLSVNSTYNLFLLFLILLLLLLEKKEASPYLIGVVASCCVLTKQSIFPFILFALIFGISYSKCKKRVVGFLIPIFVFIVYLLITNSLFPFIDYCFLGLTEFANKNFYVQIFPFILFFLMGLFLVVTFVKKYLKDNKVDRKLLYIMSFQIIAYPIFDFSHVWFCFSLGIFYVLDKIQLEKKVAYFGCFALFLFFISYPILQFNMTEDVVYFRDSPFWGKPCSNSELKFFNYIVNKIKESPAEDVFIFHRSSYLIKLFANMKINKFDLINYGNMGKNGIEKYQEKLDRICKSRKCLFILIDEKEHGQICIELLNYVQNNYEKSDKQYFFEFYQNF